jgi:hypothetical protein
MSNTAFSMMGMPDIMITVQAYTYMKLKLTDRLLEIGDNPVYRAEIDSIHTKISRVDILINVLLNEFTNHNT